MSHEIEQARTGDVYARERLVVRLTPRVDACSRYYARVSAADADDLRQEMWLGIFAALDKVDLSIGDPAQYLLQQGRFALLTYLRKERRPAAFMVLEGEQTAAASVEDEALDSQSVLAALRSAGEPGRQIIAFLLAGHSKSDVARILRCTPANITYHLKRIEARLGSVLDMEGARSA